MTHIADFGHNKTDLSRFVKDRFITAEKCQIPVHSTWRCKTGPSDLFQVGLRDTCNTVGQGSASRMDGGHKRVSKETNLAS